MNTQTLKTLSFQSPMAVNQLASKNSVAEAQQSCAAWQARFTKRLPHRLGEPLSSDGGGALDL